MPLASLWRWLTGRVGKRLDKLQVVMYTRQGCHLCEEAWEILRAEQQRHGYQLEAVDVDRSADLRALHGEQVPVVTVDGKVRFHGRVNRALLQRLLRAEGQDA